MGCKNIEEVSFGNWPKVFSAKCLLDFFSLTSCWPMQEVLSLSDSLLYALMSGHFYRMDVWDFVHVGVVQEKTLQRPPRRRCWWVGKTQRGNGLESARRFNAKWDSRLSLFHHDCRHYTNGNISVPIQFCSCVCSPKELLEWRSSCVVWLVYVHRPVKFSLTLSGCLLIMHQWPIAYCRARP